MASSRDHLPTTKGLRRQRPAPFAQQRRVASTSASLSSHVSSSSFSKRTAPGEIPYVSTDAGRTRYYADRFYLDAPTSLLEYQVDKSKKLSSSASYCGNSTRENLYCNKCGEKQEQPPPRIRYDHNRNRLPPEKSPDEHRPPLFDRAEFINSLDLAAAIIGTYTIGDLNYLKATFPALFPSSSKSEDGSEGSNRSHVPTLVLHGQKGFYLEKSEKAKVMHDVKTSIKKEKEEEGIQGEAMHLRGGGSSQSPLQSKPPPVQSREDDKEKQDEHHNFLTCGGEKLRLPKTPTRKRKGRKRVKREEEVAAASSNIAVEKSIEQVENVLSMEEEAKCAGNIDTNSDNQALPTNSSLCKTAEMKPPAMENSAPKSTVPVTSAVPTSSLSNVPLAPAQRVPKPPIDPLYSDYYDSSQDNMMSQEELANRARWAKIQPTPLFGGEVFFSRVFPGWIRPPEKFKEQPSAVTSSMVPDETVSAAFTESEANMGYSDDEEHAFESKYDEMMNEKQAKNPDMKTELGVHHPKFFLLFEKSGSIVVIISTSNLTPQNATDGSWVQRFDARHESQYNQFNQNDVDLGMPSDFGTILTDFLMKQSDATAKGSMLPDIFLRRYVNGLPLGGLCTRYKFEDAQVHLVSTVPGHHKGSIPPKGLDTTLATYKPHITYGPQRISFILSRLLDFYHMQLANNSKKSRRLVGPMWIPKRLWPAMEQLVVQPTSLGGNWTKESLEEVVAKYLQKDLEEDMDDELIEEVDIIWPSEDFFLLMKEKRHAVWEVNQNTKAAAIIRKRMTAEMKKPKRERLHVFLSSDSFAGLERSVISRMALYETSHPLQMPFTSSSLHIKSIYRLLNLTNKKSSPSSGSTETKEHFSWFMLTSACLSKGAQGKATPRRGPKEHDEMSYSNFELGVLFCSRLQEYDSDRLYVYDPQLKGCQCGSKAKDHKDNLRKSTPSNPLFLDSVRKVHLPIPFKIRATSYQKDEDYDFFSVTPYLHEITDGTKGNMKLTPYGQKLARENTHES